MPSPNPLVDAYIARAQPFAQPILRHLRTVVHRACPDVQEEMKWGFPHFTYKGMLCAMASFKAHCSFGFWKGALLVEHGLPQRSDEAMGQFGKLTSVKDLPSATVLTSLVKAARVLNEQGVKTPKRKATPAKDRVLTVPPAFLTALKANKKAHTAFDAMPYSHRKEYVQWVSEARTEPTRDKRIATSITWLSQGKSRNWQYERS